MVKNFICVTAVAILLSACGGNGRDAAAAQDVCDSDQWPGTWRRACGWPCCSCKIEDGTLFSAHVDAAADSPAYVVLDIRTLSDTHSAVCHNGELVVRGPGGELSRDPLEPETARRICTQAVESGTYRVELLCPSYPTSIQYQATIVDSSGGSVWP